MSYLHNLPDWIKVSCSSDYGWHINEINEEETFGVYEGGARYIQADSNPDPEEWFLPELSDMGFRTFVSIIPKPSTFILAALALTGLLAHGRRSRS